MIANPDRSNANGEGVVHLLVFVLGGQRYGLPLDSVREVLRAVAITPLPNAPAVVEGIVNVRGTVVPVFDPRARFGLARKDLEPDDNLIVAWAGSRLVALRADRADWLVDVPNADIQDAGTILRGAERIAGVAKLADGLVLIHDLDTFLSQSESMALDAALDAGPDA